jgi:hypothetical protein
MPGNEPESLVHPAAHVACFVDRGLHVPALVLLYSAIDTAGWLGAAERPGGLVEAQRAPERPPGDRLLNDLAADTDV